MAYFAKNLIVEKYSNENSLIDSYNSPKISNYSGEGIDDISPLLLISSDAENISHPEYSNLEDAIDSNFENWQRFVFKSNEEYPYSILAIDGYNTQNKLVFHYIVYFSETNHSGSVNITYQNEGNPSRITLANYENFVGVFLLTSISIPEFQFIATFSDFLDVQLISSNPESIISSKDIYYVQGRGYENLITVEIYQKWENITTLTKIDRPTFSGDAITNGDVLKWGFSQLYFNQNSDITTAEIDASYNSLSTKFKIKIGPEPPYDQGGQSTSGGGGGSYGGGTFGGGGQSTSDNISGSLPTGSTEVQDASTGLFTRYLCTPQFLNVLGEWLWTTDLGLAIAKAAISLFYSDPAESIISLMSFPFALSTMTGFNSVSQEFYWGNFGAGFQGTAVKSSAVQMDWGSLKIDEYWGNFLDYSPHTKVELYLPWSTGFVELDATQVVGRTISIKTNIDLNKGSCVHNVYDDLGSVIGSYSGQCGKQLPITASDFASKLASITTAAVGTAVAATVSAGSGIVNATGGEIIPFKIAGGDQGLMRQPREFNVESAKSTMQRSVKPAIASAAATALRPAHISRNGSFSDGSAGMGVQYPYIIVSRPTQSVPEEYGHHYGYPSNIYQRLQYLSGYTEIGEIHLTGIPCTDSELNELDRILKGGVLF